MAYSGYYAMERGQHLIPHYFSQEKDEKALHKAIHLMREGYDISSEMDTVFESGYFESDDEREYDALIRMYTTASDDEKSLMDIVVKILCGRSIAALIHKVLQRLGEEPREQNEKEIHL